MRSNYPDEKRLFGTVNFYTDCSSSCIDYCSKIFLKTCLMDSKGHGVHVELSLIFYRITTASVGSPQAMKVCLHNINITYF